MKTDKGVNILLIDDNKDKMLSLESILDEPELNLVTCYSGKEGLRQLLSNDFAAILLDVNMPEMDGFETAEMIRQRPRSEHTPIIFITAYSKTDLDAMKGYELGAVDFITTPVVPAVLKAKVQAFVDLFRKTEQIEHQNEELEELHRHLETMVEKRTEALQAEIAERKKAEKKIKKSLKEKEVLLAEIHHRVKNNMAVVSALLELEMAQVKDDKLKDILLSSKSRIKSMALIHEKLYQAESFSHIEFNSYVEDLINKISSFYAPTYKDIDLEVDIDYVMLNLNQAIPCALLLNELLANSFKHAFENRKKGKICIQLSEHNDSVELKVKDNGVGIPGEIDTSDSDSLGMKLVSTWVKQLKADLKTNGEEGTCFTINFLKSNRSGSGSAHFN